ncbi:3-oxoadipate enol-lactonase [Denitratisoma oestradiolicum]|uniref:3-oxoadipate enol-lactonase n=1 Tax=Denitratisoma oestradiolicum TaxID=311182 RepID=A0A6S6XXN4_9PROT|nr:3-oxoadipate enol-lactonase [Denitratisoma oestradiolicum]CAB1370754.1 3-oxoadipate enol-lactonase [Denitratisoma oestradiolicum]
MAERLRLGDLEVRYRIEGRPDAPWLTLCHPLACDLSLWDAQMAALTPHFQVLRYDLRGHGGSSAPPGPYSFPLLVDDLLGLLDALGIARSHFVGLSLGGMIGQYFALTAPERLGRLVLASTTSALGPEVEPLWRKRIARAREGGMATQVESFLERWFTAPYRLDHPALMASIAGLICATPVEGYAACAALIPTLDITARLGAIRAPTLVLAGELDSSTPPAMAELITLSIPGARQDVIPDAAHLCNVEQSERFNDLLLEFLEPQSH